jgi:hypothetical protein
MSIRFLFAKNRKVSKMAGILQSLATAENHCAPQPKPSSTCPQPCATASRFFWTKKKIQSLVRCTKNYEQASVIAARLGCEVRTVQKMQIQLHLRTPQNRRKWTSEELDRLRQIYPDTLTSAIAAEFHCSKESVYNAASRIGICKSKQFLSALASKKFREISSSSCFQPGHVPFNKGMRRPGYAPGRMAETQFKKGQRPHDWKPIGSTRFSKEGYLERKATDTGYPPRDWVGEHILLWQKTHGPVPRGYAVCFKDGDKTHIVQDNLEIVTRAELMRRNSVHNLPKPLANVIQLNGALKRRLRELDEKQT